MNLRIVFAATVAAAVCLTGLTAQAQAPVELKVGDAAPGFTLKASDGKTYSLADFKGKSAVVLSWFPKAFTGGWTAECQSLRESGDVIRQYNVQYFMISVDTLEDNTAFAKKESADFPILSNHEQDVAQAYGVLRQLQSGGAVANRWTFYIGEDGTILSIDKAVKPASAGQDLARTLGEIGIAKRQ